MSTIDYFYSAHSAFAYIGSEQLFKLCKQFDCRLIHRPIALSPVVEASGATPFSTRSRAHQDYYFGREILRWAEYRDVPIMSRRPTHHDNSLDLANGLLIAAQEQEAEVDRLSTALLKAHWVSDCDLADSHSLVPVLQSCGLDPTLLLDLAMSEEIQTIHLNNTKEAIDRGLFGSPTYIVDGDPFYGQDHLELIARALKRPFSDSTFVNDGHS